MKPTSKEFLEKVDLMKNVISCQEALKMELQELKSL